MRKYVVNRLLWTIVVLLGVAFIIFTILYFTPGDPTEMLLGANATPVELAAKRAALGIDKPYIVQLYNFYVDTFIKFDLGTSWTYETPVIDALIERLPRTVLMNLASMLITIAVGLPLGISAARHQGKWQDYGVIGGSMVLISLPSFWVALEAIVLFSVMLGWLPSHGIGGIKYYILPVLTSALPGIAGNARQMRSAMLEVIRADFVTTARAKGQEEGVIVRKHILPNAMMPVITMIGGRFGHIVSGSSITERIFSIPGVGLYLLNGISYRDYPIIRGCTLFFALFNAICVLLTDLVYAWVDPRIKAQYKSGRRR
ncbi:MAG: ABC transporter permease [Lachnospiraceae bacterium]|nr:ABC transporter permease [Lachnospiraceae bacterium]